MVHLINRSTRTSLKRMTLEESWTGTRPDIMNLRTFGCLAYVLIPKEIRVGKLAHKTCQCVFVGYSATWKAWCFWNPEKRSVIESRDAVFDERVQCCGHPLPPVDLSLLECLVEPDEEVPPTDSSPVTDADISATLPVVNPPPVLPPVDPLPLLDPQLPLPPPPPMRRHRLNEVE